MNKRKMPDAERLMQNLKAFGVWLLALGVMSEISVGY
jgi:hypothetical protein